MPLLRKMKGNPSESIQRSERGAQMRVRSRVVFVSVLLVLFSVEVFAQCGVERWSIKTGTDADAASINLSTYVSSTIYNFYQSARPASIPTNSRVAPRETTQYQLSGTLTKYVKETDKDYHLVVQDGAGRTMIVEIPDPNCVSGGAFASGISRARSAVRRALHGHDDDEDHQHSRHRARRRVLGLLTRTDRRRAERHRDSFGAQHHLRHERAGRRRRPLLGE
jgi:hypothetical protein